MATTTQTLPPQTRIDYAGTLTGRAKAVILVGVLLGLLLAALDQTIVSTAMPRIVAELQGIDLLSWVTTAYLLASTAMVPIYGKLSDLYGRKIILMFGIVLFLAGSVLCGIAPTMVMLVVFRAVQGLGAAALTSTAFAVPADLFVPAERPRYQGIFMGVFGLASVIGPFVGGLLTDGPGWRWVFYVNLPLGLLALAFIAAKMPRMHSGLRTPIDYLGAAALMLMVVPLLLALTLDKAAHAWGSPLIVGLFVLALVGLALFVLVERRAAGPIIPLKLFRIRSFSLINLVSPMIGACLFTAVLFLSLFLVNVLGVSATSAGSTLIPLMGGMVLSSIVSSQVVQRLGRYKLMILGGMLLVAAGFWWLTMLDTTTTLGGVRWRMIVLGVGLGPVMPTLTLALQNAVPFENIGAATAARQFFQQLGQVLGAAVFGAILTTSLTQSIDANLAPIKAKLPAELAAQFDTSKLKNGNATGEGAAGAPVPIEQRIESQVKQRFDQQRALLASAIRDNDPAAVQALLGSPQTPEQLRALLRAGIPAAARAQVLAQANAQLDTAQAGALAQGLALGQQVSGAVKQAFTDSVTQIYWYTIPLVLLAFLIALFIPELPLRRTNSPATVVAIE
ncbi:DHA2 family efflux MFS transporter permease subunit [Kouleothrix sp.]|uniref:DHA2 family efflux MFS transporter permease subunit n=1 Tax=Kouleothrix sp. TaxID=2779161 RepID=UPI00391D0B63